MGSRSGEFGASPVVAGDAHGGIHEETAVVPIELGAGIIGIQQAATGEPTQHSAAYRLSDGIAIPRCQCFGLSEPDSAVVDELEHTPTRPEAFLNGPRT